MGGVGEDLVLTVTGSYYGQVWEKILELVTGNAVLSIFLFGGLVAMVWRHFRSAKRAVR